MDLANISSTWSNRELDDLLFALKKDRSLMSPELSKCVETKTSAQVNELINVLMSLEENDILGEDKVEGVRSIKPEGSLDILIQTTRNLSSGDFVFSEAVGEVLEQYSIWLRIQERSKHYPTDLNATTGIRFSEMYYFLACLALGKRVSINSDIESCAILDLLQCLVQLMRLVQDKVNSNQGNNVDSDAVGEEEEPLRQAWSDISDKLLQMIGVYLSASAAVRYGSHDISPWDARFLRNQPAAPFFVLDGVTRPNGRKNISLLRQNLIKRFMELWNLPKLPPGTNSIDPSPQDEANPHSRLLIKRLATFNLNPFSLPISTMNLFQTLIDSSANAFLPHSHFLQRVNSLLTTTDFPSPSSSTSVLSKRKECTPKLTVSSKKIKRARKEQNRTPDEMNVDTEVTSETVNALQCTPALQRPTDPSTMYLSLSDPVLLEDLNKYIKKVDINRSER